MLALHIGPHKTATTYVQQNLFDSRKQLDRAGWIYPDLGTAGLPGHHDLAHNFADYVGDTAPHASALAALGKDSQAAGKNLIFSAEGFCRWTSDMFGRFADLLGQDSIDLIYVIRDPLDLFYSHWAEEVKQGRADSLPDRFTEHFNDPMASRRLNPMLDLSEWIGQERIRVHTVPYESLRNHEIDIYEHICAAVLDLPQVKASSTKPKNTSFPIELTEFLRVMTLLRGAGARRLPDRSAMRLKFTSLVSPKEQAEIVKMVKAIAPQARRVIKFPPRPFFLRRLARQLSQELSGTWTHPVGEEDLLPRREDRKYIHYDTFSLLQTLEIMQTAEDILARIAKAEMKERA